MQGVDESTAPGAIPSCTQDFLSVEPEELKLFDEFSTFQVMIEYRSCSSLLIWPQVGIPTSSRKSISSFLLTSVTLVSGWNSVLENLEDGTIMFKSPSRRMVSEFSRKRQGLESDS